jgi:drug/metabolite transporter (DMT)-like permease
MFNAFGPGNSYFVSQGVNVLYVLYGFVPLAYKMAFTPDVTPAMRAASQRPYVIMGLLDSLGTFLTAMGAVYTPGVFQTLLNQTLVPFTLLTSALALAIRYSRGQIAGALLIVAGALVTVVPAVADPSRAASAQFRWYSALVFMSSNVPMAMSSVYKEWGFKNADMDVFYQCQCVSSWQLLIGFALAPLQAVPGLGSARGVALREIPGQFSAGWRCATGADAGCAQRGCGLLLLGYVAVNFLFNALGLYLTKYGSATLRSFGFAILLPATAVTFSLPFMGSYREHLTPFTWAGLVVVLAGFVLFVRSEEATQRQQRGSGGGGGKGGVDEAALLDTPQPPRRPPAGGRPFPPRTPQQLTPRTRERRRGRRNARAEQRAAERMRGFAFHERTGGLDVHTAIREQLQARQASVVAVAVMDSQSVATAMYPQQHEGDDAAKQQRISRSSSFPELELDDDGQARAQEKEGPAAPPVAAAATIGGGARSSGEAQPLVAVAAVAAAAAAPNTPPLNPVVRQATEAPFTPTTYGSIQMHGKSWFSAEV